MGQPSSIHKAYQLHPVDDTHNGVRVSVRCLSCKWESQIISAPEAHIEGAANGMRGLTDFERGGLTDFERGYLTDFERGYLTGAFRNHACSEDAQQASANREQLRKEANIRQAAKEAESRSAFRDKVGDVSYMCASKKVFGSPSQEARR